MSARIKKQAGISPSSYNTLLKDISQIHEYALSDSDENRNKAVLFSNWKIGERIVKIEQGNKERASYGDKVLVQLSRDLNRKFGKGFSDRNLRYMRKFFQLYKLNSIHPELSWTHYRSLLLVEEFRDRIGLENLAIRDSWSHRELLKHVNKILGSHKPGVLAGNQKKAMIQRLKRPFLGLYIYRVLRKFSSNLERSVPNLDLGFSIGLGSALGEIANDRNVFVGKGSFDLLGDLSGHKVGEVLTVLKNGKGFYFETGSSFRELFTYKAYLDRVVNGDTLVVNIDLGFRIFLEQRLRLRGLEAPGLGTRKGAASKKFVESKLKGCMFLIIKTHERDKFDKYLVDVFYLKRELAASRVMKDGNFLNNELLDEGLAEPLKN